MMLNLCSVVLQMVEFHSESCFRINNVTYLLQVQYEERTGEVRTRSLVVTDTDKKNQNKQAQYPCPARNIILLTIHTHRDEKQSESPQHIPALLLLQSELSFSTPVSACLYNIGIVLCKQRTKQTLRFL